MSLMVVFSDRAQKSLAFRHCIKQSDFPYFEQFALSIMPNVLEGYLHY